MGETEIIAQRRISHYFFASCLSDFAKVAEGAGRVE
jgi:hypothetical protein